MKKLLFISMLFVSVCTFAQTTYRGFIDKYPIELVTHFYSDGDARAIYAYSNYDEPIVINGGLEKNKLTLFEKDKNNKNTAKLSFDNFDEKNDTLQGTWTNLSSGKQLKISIVRVQSREILQRVSLKNRYFKIVLAEEGSYAKVTGVRIYEKKTDKLMQDIKVDCQLLGLENIDVGDFNFDGQIDFSVFEQSYAGPNTSALYFLYDKTKDGFFNSGFEGTSLEFDSTSKTITERNSCCAGTTMTISEYKVVNNKMVLKKKRCFKWDEKKQDLVERPSKECQ